MPYPCYLHICQGQEVGSSEPVCSTCGVTGRFDAWELRLLEQMGRYQYLYGILPVGPHRPLADRLFQGSRRACETCGGSGLVAKGEEAWSCCVACEGTGGFWTISPSRVEELRHRVIAAHPHAAASSDLRFLSGNLIQDNQTGRIIDASRERRASGPSGGGGLPGAVERAFALAQSELGSHWCLKGRTRVRRVTIRSRFARRAARGAPGCWLVVTPRGSWSRRRLFPLPVVERAAAILGVPVALLVSREFA